jgi:threonine/homoserine/homoserine lactone efflux protein
MFAAMLQGVNIGFAAGMTPGPLQAFLLTQTLRHGWRRAVWIVLSPLISDGPIVALILLVLQAASDGLLRAVGLLGGAFVLYLAWGLWGQIRRGEIGGPTDEAPEAGTTWAALRQAVVINALGPGPWLFWSMVMGPLVVSTWREAPINGIGVVVSFYGTFLLTMTVQVILFHQARRLGPQAIRVGLWIGLAAMVIFALSLWVNALGG